MYNPHEARQDFLYLRNIILIAFVVMGTLMAALNARQGLAFAVLWLDGKKTIGEITGAKRALPYGIRTVSYSYRGIEGATQSAKKEYTGHVEYHPVLGDRVEVRYSRHFPSITTVTPLWSHMRYEFAFMTSGVIILVIAGGLSILAVLSIVQHKQINKFY